VQNIDENSNNFHRVGGGKIMSKKLVIILSAGAFLIMLMMGGLFFMMWSKLSKMEREPAAQEAPEQVELAVEETRVKPVFPLASFIVNLAGENGKRYLKIKMDLEITKEELNDDIRQRIPQIRDGIMMILTSKRYEDIKDTEGKISLRADIQNHVNSFFKEPCVSNVYFTDFVIQ
jgi:flagellar FliL protein